VRYEKVSRGGPDIGDSEIRGFLAARYALKAGRVRRLGGEVDQNVRVDATDGRSFVVKIASDLSDEEQLRWQCTVLRHLESYVDIPVPQLVTGTGRLRLSQWEV
jgi:Ser/Thr protein kinase RdoA (MazF antagonist)